MSNNTVYVKINGVWIDAAPNEQNALLTSYKEFLLITREQGEEPDVFGIRCDSNEFARVSGAVARRIEEIDGAERVLAFLGFSNYGNRK